MKAKFILVMLIIFRFVVNAHTIYLSDSLYKSTDSCYVFISTRAVFFDEDEQFLGNNIAKDGALRFYNIYFKGKELRIASRRSLAEAMDNANISPDFVLYTEGNGKTFSDNVERGLNASRLYGVSIIMFDWPSNVPEYFLQKNFYVSLHNCKSVTKQFHEVLLQLGDYKKGIGKEKVQHVSLFFHSLGNYVWLSTLKKYREVKDLCFVDNIIFNAPCIPSRGHEKWINKLSCQKNIYVIYNSSDRLLSGAAFLLGKLMLGRTPMRFARNACYFDLSPAAKVTHNSFIRTAASPQHPEIHTLYNNLFHVTPLELKGPHFAGVSGMENNYSVF